MPSRVQSRLTSIAHTVQHACGNSVVRKRGKKVCCGRTRRPTKHGGRTDSRCERAQVDPLRVAPRPARERGATGPFLRGLVALHMVWHGQRGRTNVAGTPHRKNGRTGRGPIGVQCQKWPVFAPTRPSSLRAAARARHSIEAARATRLRDWYVEGRLQPARARVPTSRACAGMLLLTFLVERRARRSSYAVARILLGRIRKC